MIDRLAHLVFHRRRLVLALSAAVLVAFAALAAGAFSVLKVGGFDDPRSDSSQAQHLLDTKFGGQTNLIMLVTPVAGGHLDDPAVVSAVGTLTENLRSTGDVGTITSYWSTHSDSLRTRAGDSALVTMHVEGDDDASFKAAQRIIDDYARTDATIQVRAGGQLGVNHDVTAQVGKDLGIAEGIAVPITLLLLILAFGSLVAALLPLGIGLVAIAGTFAELSLLGHVTDVSTYAINLTTALGLGLAIDYSLLIVNRFREEVAAGSETEAAIARTLHTAGRTVIFSSATVAVALAAMVIFPLYFLRSFAYAGIGVVLIAMLSALITLPALLSWLGERVNSGRVIRRRPIRPASQESAFWRRTATTVMRHPVLIALPVIALLLVMGSPFLKIVFSTPDDRALPTTLASRQVGDALRSDFPGNAAANLYVVIDGPAEQNSLDAYAARVSAITGVTSVQAPDGLWRAGQLTPASAPQLARSDARYLVVTGPTDGASAAAQQLVTTIRSVAAPAGTQVRVGGAPAQLVDSKDAIGSRLPWALLWIAVTTFVLLFLFTGSVVLPIKALLLNALSLSAVFGAMVWIFQEGHFSSLLGFTPTPINTSMPVLLFCIAFGLSMDYEVFLLSRIKEEHDHGASNTEAVAAGLARTGRIVSTAALLLSVTFFAFGTSHVSFLQLFGIGTAIAIVLDATVIRGILVPAFMKVAGEANWWAPAPLRRLHSRVGLSETVIPSDAQLAELTGPVEPAGAGRS
ncbi:RND superfamily putative drug exporter [Jatrophihabitans sp. GAS493]|uniref:MMPL family transporter n=1 Tax=Jatrophihabitans sp. GAS493 TaxID=1907575 RepID=UPI000BB9283E|nr:MMPL family transporter [Jatrophihabitans sp. GAS493]SOD70485.1 RND superfamily putative drug exporter [Jatrophihabitans sp. GAS493]